MWESGLSVGNLWTWFYRSYWYFFCFLRILELTSEHLALLTKQEQCCDSSKKHTHDFANSSPFQF